LNRLLSQRLRVSAVKIKFNKNKMNIVIRNAVEQDCERLMELVNELAVYEEAPKK
jgi:hypothetical protein